MCLFSLFFLLLLLFGSISLLWRWGIKVIIWLRAGAVIVKWVVSLPLLLASWGLSSSLHLFEIIVILACFSSEINFLFLLLLFWLFLHNFFFLLLWRVDFFDDDLFLLFLWLLLLNWSWGRGDLFLRLLWLLFSLVNPSFALGYFLIPKCRVSEFWDTYLW